MQFSLIPVKKDKKPYIKWEAYQKERPTIEEINDWWQKWPEASIGIVTGKLSGITVIDIDSEKGNRAIEQYIPDNLITPTAKSPKGKHLYFEYKEGISNATGFLDDCDIRSEGGYIIAPPSSNGQGKAYQWLVKPKEHSISIIPIILYNIINKYIYSTYADDSLQESTLSTTVYKMFNLHTRNQDLFHIVLQLFKSKTKPEIINQVLEILGKSCNPAWGSQPDDGPLNVIIESAFKHYKKKDRNLAEEVKEELLSTSGDFLSTELEKCLQVSTREEKKNLSIILKRLSEEENPIIRKNGTRRGAWTTVDSTIKYMDFVNVDLNNTVQLTLPLDIHEKTVFFPKSVIVLAGVTGFGKTTFALNFIKDNMEKDVIYYFNSEMSPEALHRKLSYFRDIKISDWNMKAIDGWDYKNVASKIFPDNLNVIDYLEPEGEKPYNIHGIVSKIVERLNKGIAFITIQKRPGADLGTGGIYSAKASSLYLSLEWGSVKIFKNRFREEDSHPLLDALDFEIFNGCDIFKKGNWYNSRKGKRE